MTSTIFKKITLIGLILLITNTTLLAQPGGGGDPECDPVLGCPIDDNVWILFVAVIGIALFKSYQKFKSTQKA